MGQSWSAAAAPPTLMLDTPAATGSFAPNITSGANGRLVLSWLEPGAENGHALRFSRFDGDKWGAVSTVATGSNWFANWADFPSVVPISETLWVAHWLNRREAGGYAYDINVAISTDSGGSWGDVFKPHTDNTDTEHGFVSMFPDNDGVGMIWLDGRKFVNEVTDDVVASGMTLRTATFASDRSASGEALVDNLICDCCQTDVAMTPSGPVAVYRNRTEQEIRDIYVTRRIDGEWQSGRPVSRDNWEIAGCPVNGPVIQSAGTTLAVTWFSAPNDNTKVQVAWSQDSAASFGPPIEVTSDKPLGHVGSALLENGDLIVSWQRRTLGGDTELCLRRVSPDGEMGDLQVISAAADIFAISVPQIAVSDDNLLIAWTTRVDDSYAIHTAMISSDDI